MPTLTETRHAGGFMASEAAGRRARETVTIVSGTGKLVPGTVLGKVTASGKYAYYNNSLATGVETAVAILWDEVDATSADKVAVVIARDAEVNAGELVWEGSQDATAKNAGIADLRALGIIAR